jgi:hypothetical protein
MRLAASFLLTLGLAAPVSAQTLADTVGGCLGHPPLRTITADPSNYRARLPTLVPGDRLLLAAGIYAQGLCCNTVSLRDSSYLAIRHLEVDGSAQPDVDGVKAEGDAAFTHHITLEDLDVHDHDANQEIVGINTKCPSWNWVIRRNIVRRAGTGLYLGNSDGTAEFVNSLVEHNLVYDTIGYNMQIKHQEARPSTALGAPANGTTVIRHNVFSKASGGGTGADARPNLLVSHWPLTGPGSSDVYLIYGNLLYQNPTEALFQAAGHVAFYANLLVNDPATAPTSSPASRLSWTGTATSTAWPSTRSSAAAMRARAPTSAGPWPWSASPSPRCRPRAPRASSPSRPAASSTPAARPEPTAGRRWPWRAT